MATYFFHDVSSSRAVSSEYRRRQDIAEFTILHFVVALHETRSMPSKQLQRVLVRPAVMAKIILHSFSSRYYLFSPLVITKLK